MTSDLRSWTRSVRKNRRSQSAKKAAATLKERHGDDHFARMGQRRQAQLRGRDYENARPGARVWVPGPDADTLIAWLWEASMGIYDWDPRKAVVNEHIERLKRAFPQQEETNDG